MMSMRINKKIGLERKTGIKYEMNRRRKDRFHLTQAACLETTLRVNIINQNKSKERNDIGAKHHGMEEAT